jgi:hypothetical protein
MRVPATFVCRTRVVAVVDAILKLAHDDVIEPSSERGEVPPRGRDCELSS